MCTCNSCADCTNAINAAVCTEIRLTANISNQVGHCIYTPANFSSKTFNCQGNTIDGDDSGTNIGIAIYEKSFNTVKNCTITDFMFGIHIGGGANNNTLSNNNLTSNTQAGIYIETSSYNNLLNNIANSNTWYGIEVADATHGNVIIGNTANLNRYGISVTDNDNIVANNVVNINRDYGIYLSDTSNTNVTNNTANFNGIYGFYLSNLDSGVFFSNTGNLNNRTGLFVADSSGGNTITSSYFQNNNQTGVNMSSGSSNNFTSNTVSGNNVGFAITASGNTFNDIMAYSNTFNFQSTGTISINLTNFLVSGTGGQINYPLVQITNSQSLGSSKVVFGNYFISLNSTSNDPFNTTAEISLNVSNCSVTWEVYKKHGFAINLDDILQNGTLYTPSSSSCTNSVFTFTVDSFSGYGVQEGIPEVDSAMKKVQHFEYGDHSKITYSSEGNFISEGGNITENNLTSNLSTEKWAGIYGTLQGTLSLGKNSSTTTYSFYTWTISDVSGSKVCAQRDGTEFNWGIIASATTSDVDAIWGFTSTDIDSVNSTYSTTCSNFKIAGTTVASTIGVANIGNSANDFTNCAFTDGSTTSKSHFAFCTVADTTGLVMDTVEADYAIMLPTNEQDGQTETYDIFVQLA